MKKRALVAGVLLSVFSMGMSAQAAMTISNAGETKLSDIDIDLWANETNPGLTIIGDNEKTLNFTFESGYIGDAGGPGAAMVEFTGSKGEGIYHDAGTTYFKGLDLSIYGNNRNLFNDNGYRAINNLSGNMIFENPNLWIDVTANREAIYNRGTINFNGDFLRLYRVYSASHSGSMSGAILNDGIMNIDSNNVIISSSHIVNGESETSGCAIENNGTFEFNPNNNSGSYYIYGDIKISENNSTRTIINLHGYNNSPAQLLGDINAREYFYGDTRRNFQLNLTGKNAAWILDEDNNCYVPNVNLKENASIILNAKNLNTNTDWNRNFKNLNLSNLRNDGTGVVQLTTDLKNNMGDSLTLYFSDMTPTLTSLNIDIINKDNNNGIPIKKEEGHSVTILSAPSYTELDLNVNLSFHGQYNDNILYNPLIEQIADSSFRNWNFVGWEAGGGKTTNKEKDQQLDGFDINATELDNTLKRLNDIRTDPSEVGAWIRGESGKMKIRSYSYKYNLTSGGYDWDFESEAAKMFLGFGISYAKNDCDTGMIGDTKSMGYNLYGSWLGKDNKDYIDVILKYGKLDKKYAGLDDNNVFVRGDYDKNLFSIAAKYGRRIEREDGWYYEPSVGLTWGRIGSADFTDSQGIHIHADSSTSKMASLGMQVGKNVQGTEFYGLVQVRHDFDGKMHVSVPGSDLPGSSVYDDMGGTWYKVGIGAARKINKNNSFYLDLEKDFGNKVKKPYSIGAGYRYTW